MGSCGHRRGTPRRSKSIGLLSHGTLKSEYGSAVVLVDVAQGAASTHCQALPRHQAGLNPNVMGSLPRRGEAVTADAGLRRRRQAKRSASHQPREASFNPILYEKGAQCHQNFAG